MPWLDKRAGLPGCLVLVLTLSAWGEAPAPKDAEPVVVRHGGMVIAVAFSPDGKLLATGGWDNLVRLWDPATGKELKQLKGHPDPVFAVAFSPDGKLLASSGQNGTIRLWDWDETKERIALQGHQGGGTKVVFTPDGKTLISGSYDKTIRLWDVATGMETRRLTGHQSTIYSIAVSPDGKLLASGGSDRTIRLWDLNTNKELRQIGGAQGTINGCSALAFSPDGKTLASGNTDHGVYLWEVATGQERLVLQGHQNSVWAVCFSPSGRTLASGGSDRSIRLWELPTGKPVHQLEAHKGGVAALTCSPDGKKLASASHDQTALVYDLNRLVPESRPRVESPAAGELAQCWDSLAGADAVKAYQAMNTLAAAARQSVPFLQAHFRPSTRPDPKRIARLVADLDDDAFAVREEATRALEMLGGAAEPALLGAFEKPASPEVLHRVRRLLERLERFGLPPEQLRLWRSIEILEQADTGEARGLLETLARERSDGWLAEAAQASLDRITKRSAVSGNGGP